MRFVPLDPLTRVIVPWYQTDVFHLLIFALMSVLLLFAAVGLGLAWTVDAYNRYYWQPFVLLVPSGIVLLNSFVRLACRLFK